MVMRTGKSFSIEPAIPRVWGCKLKCADGDHDAEFTIKFADEQGRYVDYCGEHLAETFGDINVGKAKVREYRTILTPLAYIG
jgi:hypothetical protein